MGRAVVVLLELVIHIRIAIIPSLQIWGECNSADMLGSNVDGQHASSTICATSLYVDNVRAGIHQLIRITTRSISSQQRTVMENAGDGPVIRIYSVFARPYGQVAVSQQTTVVLAVIDENDILRGRNGKIASVYRSANKDPAAGGASISACASDLDLVHTGSALHFALRRVIPGAGLIIILLPDHGVVCGLLQSLSARSDGHSRIGAAHRGLNRGNLNRQIHGLGHDIKGRSGITAHIVSFALYPDRLGAEAPAGGPGSRIVGGPVQDPLVGHIVHHQRIILQPFRLIPVVVDLVWNGNHSNFPSVGGNTKLTRHCAGEVALAKNGDAAAIAHIGVHAVGHSVVPARLQLLILDPKIIVGNSDVRPMGGASVLIGVLNAVNHGIVDILLGDVKGSKAAELNAIHHGGNGDCGNAGIGVAGIYRLILVRAIALLQGRTVVAHI